jgi:membrane dipeptidase
MTSGDLHPVFDGHNDVLLRLFLKKTATPARDFLQGDGEGHLDMPRLHKGGFAGGFFAIFVPDGKTSPADDDDPNPPAAPRVSEAEALPKSQAMAALLAQIERESEGTFRICRSVADIRDCLARGTIAAIMHIEGAEMIDPGFTMLDMFHAAGLRSLGPVWSRPNRFGHGVPFRFPSTPDTGPGLTAAGKALIRACNARRVLIDLSHLNERGFWDVAEISNAPLVATHSNAHVLCPSSRNLTDRQIEAIGKSGGMIGLNFANGFLRADGRWRNDTPVDVVLAHLDHLLAIAGEDCVGLGSDFDGARIPAAIGSVTGLPGLQVAMRAHGYSDRLIGKLCHENWLRVLEQTWGS